VLFLFFLLVSGDIFLHRLVEILPCFSSKRQVVEISQQIESDISAYLVTITIMNAAVGIAMALAMWHVGLNHRGVHAHFAARRYSIALSYFHQSLVYLFDHFGPQGQAPAPHGLGIGRLRTAHTGELAVHQIGAHLALQYRVTPVADVLEDQQAQDYFGRSSQPAAAAAPGVP